ncbi:hypothetical protein FRC12_017656 [Ceratobasidium sp. 428]|nr:hypothetical protein FRC12_017656 [Ceratobasidium sp. 428]
MHTLSLEGLKPDAIPQLDSVLAAAKALLEDIPSGWRQGREYHGVKTSSRSPWFSRTSLHSPADGTFDEFWDCLGVNHSVHEQQYIPEIQSAVSLGTFGAFEGWSLLYKFSPPLSNRIFTLLIASVLEDTEPRQGYVISLPFDVGCSFAWFINPGSRTKVSTNEELKNKEPKGVRGRYVSVERVRELDGQVEWTMATMSNPGGMVPLFLSNSQMPSKIAEDVPHVLEWLKGKRVIH